jgi:glycosyltransferase involved in cell wall biosynthesis
MEDGTATVALSSGAHSTENPVPIHDARLRVSWLGTPPSWLAAAGAAPELEAVDVSAGQWLEVAESHRAGGGSPDIVHVERTGLDRLSELRRAASGSALVLDLTGGDSALRRSHARAAEAADLILVGSLAELSELRRRFPSLTPRTALLRPPVDLETYATESELLERRNRDIRRFRSFHRLAGPTVLFVGPFTEAGGLDLALDAVHTIREHMEDVRLTAIPEGPIERRYLDRCERKALGLGHHGVIEWTVNPSELPLWYGTATVVCLPRRESVSSEPARLAAAAAKPVVGTEVDSLLEYVVDGETGSLVPVGNPSALVAALLGLLGDEEEAARLGATARKATEAADSPAAVARQLVQRWAEAVEQSVARRASTNGHR